MELGIISDEIDLDLEKCLKLNAAFGFQKFEIRCIDDYEHRVPDLPPGTDDRIEELVKAGKMVITGLSPGTFKINLSDTAELRRQMDDILPRSCVLAKRFGAPRLITFAFMREAGTRTKEVVARLREAGLIAMEHGIELCVENEPGSWCDTGVNTARIVEEIDQPQTGINWDPANAVYAGEAAYPVGYDAVLPWIRNVHIKDGIPLPDGKWENRLLGDGGVNWIGQLKALFKDRPVSHLTLETHVFPLFESTTEDLRRLHLLMETAKQFD